MSSDNLTNELDRFYQSYVELFGAMPPLPAAKFTLERELDPEFLRLNEQLRAHAFYSPHFDLKTTQLILFGMLLVKEAGAARHHAQAARRAGATWEELHQVIALASAVSMLGPVNGGSSMLLELRAKEETGQ